MRSIRRVLLGLLLATAASVPSLAASETFFWITTSDGQEIMMMVTEYAPGEMFVGSTSSYSTISRIPLGPAATSVAEGSAYVAGGLPVVIGLAAVLTYESYEYYSYTQQMVHDVGSEPAHNLTEYEDPSNYGEQFMRHYFPSYYN